MVQNRENAKRKRLLDVAIVTWRPDGILRVARMVLPEVEGVTYVVSWQSPGERPEIPEALRGRDDVEIHLFEGRGVSANRNNACGHCLAPIVLNGDDDLKYDADGLRGVIDAFAGRPEMDVAAFRYKGEDKVYPPREMRLGLPMPKGYGVATFEIAFRRRLWEDSGRKGSGGLRFDRRFGPGAPVWQAAEDEVFMFDAIRKGYECRFIPLTVMEHDHPTTGSRPMTEGVAAAAGKFIRMSYPGTWLLRIPLKAWRERRKGGRIWFSLSHMLRGAFSDGGAISCVPPVSGEGEWT